MKKRKQAGAELCQAQAPVGLPAEVELKKANVTKQVMLIRSLEVDDISGRQPLSYESAKLPLYGLLFH